MGKWSWVAIDLVGRDSMYGKGWNSRAEAIADTKGTFDMAKRSFPKSKHGPLDAWLAGTAKDDTVVCGNLVFGLIPYNGSAGDLEAQAQHWVTDFISRVPGAPKIRGPRR